MFEEDPMANENQGLSSGLRRALGFERGPVDVVKLSRWVGVFLLVSTLWLAAWNFIDPTIVGGGGEFSFTARLRMTWLAIVSPGWNAAPIWVGVAVIVLAEIADRPRRST